MAYEVRRDTEQGPERHPEQPEQGFQTAEEASDWCDTSPRHLDGRWYINPVDEEC
jgi:hypothetical protein